MAGYSEYGYRFIGSSIYHIVGIRYAIGPEATVSGVIFSKGRLIPRLLQVTVSVLHIIGLKTC